MKYDKRPLEKVGRFLIDRRRPLENRTALAGEVPLWWLAPPPCPVGSMSLDSRVAGLPYESSSFATPSSRGHNKAPRFYLFISCSTLSMGCSAPACGGSPAWRERGEASAASQSAECFSHHMTLKANPVTLTLCSSPERAIPQPSA